MKMNWTFQESILMIPRCVWAHWTRSLFCALAILAVSSTAHPGQESPEPQNPNKPLLMPEANRPPDMNDQMRMREQKVRQFNFDAINLRRKNKIAADSAMLLTLAIALKAEIDNSPGQKPSATELRKAEGIEKLAHNVKEAMQLTIGPN
jgi:hypothetical protein